MKKLHILIILISLFVVVVAGTFTYKIRPNDTFNVGSVSNPRAVMTTTGVTLPGTLTVSNAVIMASHLTITSNFFIGGTFTVSGTTVFSNTIVYVNFSIAGDLTVASNSVLNGSLTVAGASILSNTLTLISDMTISGDLDIVSNVTITGTLNVAGQVNISNNVISFESVIANGTNLIVDPDILVSLITTTGAETLILSNGSFTGQTKKIILSVDGGDLTLTPVNFADATGLTFDAQMDSVELLFDGSSWNMISASSVATN